MDTKKKNIYLFYGIALLQGMVFYGPIATLYRQARGLSVFEITLIESISLIVMIALEVPWGYISDKIGYKKTIILCNTLYFISKVVFWQADNFVCFLAERLILSVVLSGISGCDSAYLYLSAGEKESKRVFGIYNAMSTAGLICASTVFSLSVKNNYRLAAFLTVISYCMAMALSLCLTDVKPKASENNQFNKQLKMAASALGKNKGFILFLIAAALLAETNQTITVFLNQLQYLRSGILPEYMGYIYILVTVSGLISAYCYRLTERLGESVTMKLLFCTACLACSVMAIVSNPVLSVMSIVLLRMSASIFVPLGMVVQNRQVTVSERTTMLSVYSIVMNMIAAGTNLVFGKMADMDIKYAMAAGSVFCLAGLIICCLPECKKNL